MRLRRHHEHRHRGAGPDKPDFMRHDYHCNDCGADATFDVAKKAKG
jgi:hypothetical protein